MREDLRISVTVTEGIAVLGLAGDLDLGTASGLLSCIEELGDARVVRLDLAELRFLDSLGISLLVGLRQQLGVELRSLELTNVVAQPRAVLEMTGLAESLGISATPG